VITEKARSCNSNLTTSRTKAANVTAILASRTPSSLPLRCMVSMKVGTNAAERAPSANSRRSRFGMRKATKNASAPVPAPRNMAMIMSRINPEIRLTLVQKPTIPAALVINFFSDAIWFFMVVGFKLDHFSDVLIFKYWFKRCVNALRLSRLQILLKLQQVE